MSQRPSRSSRPSSVQVTIWSVQCVVNQSSQQPLIVPIASTNHASRVRGGASFGAVAPNKRNTHVFLISDT